MERTRIIHYTHSRTPVVFPPSTPNRPRLSTSSSLSSLVSCIDDKAPLASIDPEKPSRSRKTSNASDRSSSTRSSSTGRLFDDSKLGTSVLTAVLCQDYPSVSQHSPVSLRERKGAHHNKERPVSAYPVFDTSPDDDLHDNRRHTLGSWSRSRRGPSTESPNTSQYRKNCATLPKNLDRNGSSSSTLVRPRRRYTWISPRKVTSPGAASTLPSQSPVTNDAHQESLPEDASEESHVNNKPESLTSPVGPDPAKTSPSAPTTSDCVPETSPHISSVPSVVSDSSRQELTSGTPSSSPISNSRVTVARSHSDVYDWKKDPRRRPRHFDLFNLSLSPPKDQFQPPNLDVNVSHSSSTSENNQFARIPSPVVRKGFGSRPYSSFSSHDWRARRYSAFSGSPNLSTRNGGCGSDQIYDNPQSSVLDDWDITPVGEHGPAFPQCLSTPNSKHERLFQPSMSQDGSTKINSYQSNNSFCRFVCGDQKSGANQNRVNGSCGNQSAISVVDDTECATGCPCTAGKKNHVACGSISLDRIPSGSNSHNNCLASPRTCNSFRMAMDGCGDHFSIGGYSGVLDRCDSTRSGNSPNAGFPVCELDSCRVVESNENNPLSQDELFVSCSNLTPQVQLNNRNIKEPNNRLSMGLHQELCIVANCSDNTENITNQNDLGRGDSLSRRIKRNSMRLATSSISDLTCALDDIDIDAGDLNNSCQDTSKTVSPEIKTSQSVNSSPSTPRANLPRTGSLLSSKNSSSKGSYFSCHSKSSSDINSPAFKAPLRSELKARLDSPNINRPCNNNPGSDSDVDQEQCDSWTPRMSRSGASSPCSSTASSSRSSHRQKHIYFWTRQSPYPRLLFTASSSVSSSTENSEHRCPSLKPFSSSSNHPNSSQSKLHYPCKENEHSENLKSMLNFSKHSGEDSRISTLKETPSHLGAPLPGPSRPMSLSLFSSPLSQTDAKFQYYIPQYETDLTPTNGIDSPNSDNGRSPPSLGRPRRKQYAGFDSQPLPMDSFMSDSSSVYTGVSCSSRGTDMTGQHDVSQFDDSFISEDISNYAEESRDDIPFGASETLLPVFRVDDFSSLESESQGRNSSTHSSSTTKQGNGDSSLDEKDQEDSFSLQESSFDVLIDDNEDCITSKFGKQFGPEYDAIFRLYKSDDVLGQRDLFTPPSYPLWQQNGKALSSSCLLRSKLYSKRKFLSTRDIFDLMRNSDKSPLGGTVSLTSLEQQAHRVCEAILRCDEMEQGYKETHSLV